MLPGRNGHAQGGVFRSREARSCIAGVAAIDCCAPILPAMGGGREIENAAESFRDFTSLVRSRSCAGSFTSALFKIQNFIRDFTAIFPRYSRQSFMQGPNRPCTV